MNELFIFAAGVAAGFALGVIIMALAIAGSREDDRRGYD